MVTDEDKVLSFIAQEVAKEEAGTFVEDEPGVERVKRAYELTKEVVKGEGVKVTYELHEPFVTMGAVIVEGKNIQIYDTETFREVVELAANMDVCTKTNGNVELDLTFYGLARKEGD